MSDTVQLQQQIDRLEQEVATLKRTMGRQSVRKRSTQTFCGLPLYDIAYGPDPERNEIRGHARGIIAMGDIATGVVALGGVARGVIACGGLAMGGVTLGGCSLGLLLGIGGFATGALALGGAAIGFIALGGGAMGYYACGGQAVGAYILSGLHQDPEAIRVFGQWIPGIDQLVQNRGR